MASGAGEGAGRRPWPSHGGPGSPALWAVSWARAHGPAVWAWPASLVCGSHTPLTAAQESSTSCPRPLPWLSLLRGPLGCLSQPGTDPVDRAWYTPGAAVSGQGSQQVSAPCTRWGPARPVLQPLPTGCVIRACDRPL